MTPAAHAAKTLLELEDVEIVNTRRYKKLVCQRRFMLLATIGTLVSVVLFIVAIATAMWAIVQITVPSTASTVTVYLGIWGEYRIDSNASHTTSLWIRHFPEPPAELTRLEDVDLPHFYRTQATFAAIDLFLMVVGNALAIYCFFQHRYVYKRLVAGLFVFIALCTVVIIEVLDFSMEEWNKIKEDQKQLLSKTERKKTGYMSLRQFGYSAILAWIVFGIHIVAAIIFFCASKKHKGSRAATQEFEEDDRPVIIGR